MRKRIVTILAFALCFIANAQHYVGMDLSLLPQYEKHNKPYLDKEGAEISDMLTWLPTVGVNAVRVRLFVNPKGVNAKGSRDVAVCQDLDYVKAFGARIKAAGLNFMLDLHYSDTWADPSAQKLPEDWKDCKTADEKAARVYTYTKDVLEALTAANATPDFVQVGNEITNAIADVKIYENNKENWTDFVKVLEQGCKAVREECPKAKIVIHTEKSGNANSTVYFYDKINSLDYDIIGLSYYPFWHGFLPDLEKTLTALAKDFPNKEVQIVETAYNFQYEPKPETVKTSGTWPYTEAGQKKFIEDLTATLNKFPQVNGMYYWFPEEAGNGDDTNWNTGKATVLDGWCNRGLWKSEVEGKGHKCNAGLYSLQAFSTSSSIENVSAEYTDRQKYNLSGQKISEPAKGEVFIQQGKKYIAR